MLQKTRALALAAFTTIIVLFLLYNGTTNPFPKHHDLTPANATLGFGTILAVSRPHSRRLPDLLWAANLTDLTIVIPQQPSWNISDLHAFRLDQESSISEGSARAWLGHLHTLQYFLKSGKETALIIEDDVDWDISIRHQMSMLASHIQQLLSLPSSSQSTRKEEFGGSTTEWDILYPGHCDDLLPSSESSFLEQPHVLYEDQTVPAHTLLHPDTANFLRASNIPEQTRILHRTFAPFCTCAYAVNRRSAEKIVTGFNTESEGVSAFDVQLLRACAKGWRCYSVAPEPFHHTDGASMIASVDVGDEGGREEVGGSKKGTWNIGCGARHAQLWIDEDDAEGREEAKRVVNEMLERGQNECPIDLVKAERSWRGCEWGECGAQS